MNNKQLGFFEELCNDIIIFNGKREKQIRAVIVEKNNVKIQKWETINDTAKWFDLIGEDKGITPEQAFYWFKGYELNQMEQESED